MNKKLYGKDILFSEETEDFIKTLFKLHLVAELYFQEIKNIFKKKQKLLINIFNNLDYLNLSFLTLNEVN